MLLVLFQFQDDDLFIAMNRVLRINVAQIVDHNRVCHYLRYYTSLDLEIILPGA